MKGSDLLSCGADECKGRGGRKGFSCTGYQPSTMSNKDGTVHLSIKQV